MSPKRLQNGPGKGVIRRHHSTLIPLLLLLLLLLIDVYYRRMFRLILGSRSRLFGSFDLPFFVGCFFGLLCCCFFLFFSFCFIFSALLFVGSHLGCPLCACLFFACLKFFCRLWIVSIFHLQIRWQLGESYFGDSKSTPSHRIADS
jgi:hypothetical protein